MTPGYRRVRGRKAHYFDQSGRARCNSGIAIRSGEPMAVVTNACRNCKRLMGAYSGAITVVSDRPRIGGAL